MQEQPDHGDLGLFAHRKTVQAASFLSSFCKTKAGKDPVVFLLPGETLPIPFIRTGAASSDNSSSTVIGEIRKSLLAAADRWSVRRVV